MNLAFSDLIYCALCLSTNAISLIKEKWEWGIHLCIIYANILHATAYSAFMSVAMIALSRCIAVTNIGKPTIFSSKRNQILIVVSIRLYGFILLIPTNLKVNCPLLFLCIIVLCITLPTYYIIKKTYTTYIDSWRIRIQLSIW